MKVVNDRESSISQYVKYWLKPREAALKSGSNVAEPESDDSVASNLTQAYYGAVTWLYELGGYGADLSIVHF